MSPQIVMTKKEKRVLVDFYRALEKLRIADSIDYEGFLITLREGGERSQGMDIVVVDDAVSEKKEVSNEKHSEERWE